MLRKVKINMLFIKYLFSFVGVSGELVIKSTKVTKIQIFRSYENLAPFFFFFFFFLENEVIKITQNCILDLE